MTKRKNNKRALIVSALSLLLCVSMLVGSTMAWFTDNASTGVNTIQAGTLDIVLEMWDGENWVEAEGKTLNFIDKDENNLWEPGVTYELNKLRIRNNGNLAARFEIVLSGIEGDAKLNEAIEWSTSTDAGEGLSYYDYNTENGIVYGLKAGGNVTFTLSGHMKEEAGNEYQGLSIQGASITVIATQLPDEHDSFNNTYDVAATYGASNAKETVTGDEELKEALAGAQTGDVFGLNSGSYDASSFENAEDVTFVVTAGQDVTIKMDADESITTNASKNEDEVKINEPTILNQGNLTIEGGTISNKNATAGNTNVAAIKNVSGTLTLKNTTIENVAPTSGGAYAVVVSGGKVVLDNCNVKGGRGGIAVSGNGSVEMTGGTVTAGKYYPLYIMGTGDSTFDDVTFVNASKPSVYNEFKENEGTATFTNCTFNNNGTTVYNNNMTGLSGIS